MAQFFSYTFLPSDIAPAVRRRDLKMSLTGMDPNSPGLARNSPYSSSGSVAGDCCAAVTAAAQIPNTTKVAEIRWRVRLVDRDKTERHVATCLLPTICFLRHACAINASKLSFFSPIVNGTAGFRQDDAQAGCSATLLNPSS